MVNFVDTVLDALAMQTSATPFPMSMETMCDPVEEEMDLPMVEATVEEEVRMVVVLQGVAAEVLASVVPRSPISVPASVDRQQLLFVKASLVWIKKPPRYEISTRIQSPKTKML